MFLNPQDVTKITSIGGGPIGVGWAAHFLARGFDVTLYLHDAAEIPTARAILDTAWISLAGLGIAPNASIERLSIVHDLEEAVSEAEFIQESAPERLEVKQALYRRLGEIVPEGVVIGSSTSGLTMTDIQAECPTPKRTVIGHPFNPPYLLPLVEIVGGRKTDPGTVSWAADFYRLAGKEPLVMKKEIPGFIATRLQEALWREALHMVANGEASPGDIDTALMYGPAPRMAVQGQCMAFHVACGAGGMATNLDQFGPALKLPWTRLTAPELTKELRDRMVDGCNEIAAGRGFEELAAKRDRQIVALLKAVRDAA
ncbi:3-hydroxybutyryl-CoA dehydrogenase (plasmid) [Aminobacter sp. SR38]|jgi:carnitine 3-dehydrogenase|uniref:3-hydroxyacyl-CoA dehydrogenase NAD-binding domain-containing protein n=1 Tax=Aminobacter sp. SR38 TaxID=2774562 RepID=UPI0017834FE0|nr:3-hydroxyacyl-CoA dehydrogenase NAD-binding domain-containing protein [Aminobacter sp. SR38]QOF75069.1 3-hydroxybutyryl-CoA dehydrogenase [Aminobacter sp. SR38]